MQAKTFPNLGKEFNIQIQKAFKTSNNYHQKISSPHHITVKILETKRREY